MKNLLLVALLAATLQPYEVAICANNARLVCMAAWRPHDRDFNQWELEHYGAVCDQAASNACIALAVKKMKLWQPDAVSQTLR